MRGLDPRIHDETQRRTPYVFYSSKGLMGCRVRPGNDSGEVVGPWLSPPTRRAPSPYRGERLGEGDRADRKDVTPHPPASGGRPLPMGEVKRALGTAYIIGVNEASHRHVPDLAGVFSHGAVGGEPAHARRVENRHAPPVARRAPQRVDLALRFPVGVE